MTIPDPMTPPPSMATFLIFAGSMPSIRGSLPAAPCVEKDADEVLGHVRNSAVSEEPHLLFDVGLDVIAETLFKGVNGLERRNIPLGLLIGHELGVIEQGGLFRGTGNPVIDVARHAHLEVQLPLR